MLRGETGGVEDEAVVDLEDDPVEEEEEVDMRTTTTTKGQSTAKDQLLATSEMSNPKTIKEPSRRAMTLEDEDEETMVSDRVVVVEDQEGVAVRVVEVGEDVDEAEDDTPTRGADPTAPPVATETTLDTSRIFHFSRNLFRIWNQILNQNWFLGFHYRLKPYTIPYQHGLRYTQQQHYLHHLHALLAAGVEHL